MHTADALGAQVEAAAARALGEQDANPHSATAGCFDRRYWAWKLVDFPEATFQRLVLPLATLYRDPASRYHGQPEVLAAVRAGLAYVTRIQHGNGSFDQAFPFEQSYGATAFLLSPILEAARLVDEHLTPAERAAIEGTGRRAAEFLCGHEERHGVIANHLAGAAWSLVVAADRFREPRYEEAASRLVAFLLERQSPEGWWPEYDGADPGYQTLCVDYLSAIAERRPSEALARALDRAVEFLQWFVHPDGTFGGVYGSRRTSLVYLAGLARLAPRSAPAAAMCRALAAAMARGDLAGPASVDAGNLAPMLTSTAMALPLLAAAGASDASLPCERTEVVADFTSAGLHIRGTAHYYAVCGVANGGTLTVFAGEPRRLVLDDGGYVAEMEDGARASTQATRREQPATVEQERIELTVPFVRMPSALPTPGRFVALRLLNLTLMRSIAAGNWVKRRLVGLLMAGGDEVALTLTRRITFGAEAVEVTDRIESPGNLALRALTGGQPFSSIHMASAGYFHGARLGTARPATVVDLERLSREGVVELTTRVDVVPGTENRSPTADSR
ncbi:MAG: hypothetical protein Q8L86_16575 [Vicinamibacterales bacterium]|nr:hypothetical protein [Vicinamibacterales bacterium]